MSESNRRTRICNPLHNHSANRPLNEGAANYCGAILQTGAGNETRTRDPDLGKVVLYQLSYSRFVLVTGAILYDRMLPSTL